MANVRTAPILPALILLLLQASVLRSAPMTNLPLDHWAYEYVDELRVRGLFPSLFSGTRPYTRGEIAQAILDLLERVREGDILPKDYEWELVEHLQNEFETEIESLEKKETVFQYGADFHLALSRDEDKLRSRGWVSPWGDLDLGDRGAIHSRMKVDTEGKDDPDFRGRVWKDALTGTFESSYLQYGGPDFRLLMGREKLLWGPGREGALIVSDNSPSFDLIALKARFRRCEVTAFSSVLNSIEPDTQIGSTVPILSNGNNIRRYLSGHRIGVKIGDGIEFGASEVVLYGGPNRSPELYYVNPLMIYYATQFNMRVDDNLLWDLDVSIRPLRNLELYGEFLIDDFQYEHESPGDYEPPELGYLAGIYLCDPFGIEAVNLRAEYMRVNAWTYNQIRTRNKYTHCGSLIGSWFGPDGDHLHLELSRNFDRRFRLVASYDLKRKGENYVDTPWPEDNIFPEEWQKNYFLTGTVEKRHLAWVEFLYAPTVELRISLGVGYTSVHNEEHMEGEGAHEPRGALLFSYWLDRLLRP